MKATTAALCWCYLIYLASLSALWIAVFYLIDGEWVAAVLAFVLCALLLVLLVVAPWIIRAGEGR